jgi:hypothetical protein
MFSTKRALHQSIAGGLYSAYFHLQIVLGADHKVDSITDRIEQTEGMSLAQKAQAHWAR